MIPLTEIIDWQGITLSVTYTPQGAVKAGHCAVILSASGRNDRFNGH